MMLIEVSNKEELNKCVEDYKNKGYVEEKDKLIYRLLKKVNFSPNIKNDGNQTKVFKESIVRKILVLIPLTILCVIFLLTIVLIPVIFYLIMKSDKFNKDVITITTDKLNLNVNIGGKARVEKVANKKELEFMTTQYNTAGYKTEVIGVDYARLSKKEFKTWLFIILFFLLFIGAIIYLIYYAIKEKEIIIIKIDENNPKNNIKDNSTNISNDNTENKTININENNIEDNSTTTSDENNIIYCTECGSSISVGSKFCKNCGKQVE